MESTGVRDRNVLSRRAMLGSGVALGLVGGSAARAADAQAPALRTIVDTFAHEQGFQGVVLFRSAGRPDFSAAIGLADRAKNVPMRAETAFGIASVSKRLTAVATLRLVERGRLTLDAPITRWLPWYRADTGARVTLRHLLSNSSGIPNAYAAAQKADSNFVPPRKRYAGLVGASWPSNRAADSIMRRRIGISSRPFWKRR
jgi:D-alanyl-D-alanine carboxypeptidase